MTLRQIMNAVNDEYTQVSIHDDKSKEQIQVYELHYCSMTEDYFDCRVTNIRVGSPARSLNPYPYLIIQLKHEDVEEVTEALKGEE